MDGFGPLSTMFVSKDAVGHMTQFWPPDWLLLCTSSIPQHQGDSHFTWFPVKQPDGRGSLVSTFSSFYPVTRVWYLSFSMPVDQNGVQEPVRQLFC